MLMGRPTDGQTKCSSIMRNSAGNLMNMVSGNGGDNLMENEEDLLDLTITESASSGGDDLMENGMNLMDSAMEVTEGMDLMEVQEGSVNDLWTFAWAMGGSFAGVGSILGLIYLIV